VAPLNILQRAWWLVLLAAAGLALQAFAGPPRLQFPDDVFPLAVWLQQPVHAQKYKTLGINLYVGLWKGPTANQLATLKQAGMPVICEQNELGLSDRNRDIIIGCTTLDRQGGYGAHGLGLARISRRDAGALPRDALA
jgi:hypothetical protein